MNALQRKLKKASNTDDVMEVISLLCEDVAELELKFDELQKKMGEKKEGSKRNFFTFGDDDE